MCRMKLTATERAVLRKMQSEGGKARAKSLGKAGLSKAMTAVVKARWAKRAEKSA